MKRNLTINIICLIILSVLWGFRIGFNSGDQAISLGLDIIVFLGSLCLLLWNVWFYPSDGLAWLKNHKEIVIVLGAMILFEISFMLKNGFVPTWAYFFGALLGFLIWLWIAQFTKGTFRIVFLLISIIIFMSYTLGQDVYYRIFREFFSFKEALTLREGIESGESMYRFHVLHLWVITLTIIAVFSIFKYRSKDPMNPRFSLRQLLSIGFVGVLLLMNMNYPNQEETIFSADTYLYTSVYSKRDFAKHFGFFHLMGRDLLDALVPIIPNAKDEGTIEDLLSSLEKSPSVHEHVGEFEGKNLVFILAESYDEIALDPILTPHIYRLRTEGYHFNNHYTPVFQRTTSDTEFIFNTGWIPSIEDGPTVSIFRDNTYPESLANRFNDKGYLTQAFHGNYKEFYGRHIVYENYGFDAFYGRDELDINPTDGRFDSRLFEQAKDLILPTHTPFMSFIITFSGHSPYNEHHDVANEYYDFVHSIYHDVPEELKYYLAVQVELDHMIEKLLDSLDEKGLMDDTVILLSGDHYPYTMTQSIYEDASDHRSDHEKYQGNLYLWSNSMTPQTIEKQTTSFDILPTLSVLFNLSQSEIELGHDMFSSIITPVYTKHYAYIMNGSFVQLTDPNPITYLERERIAKHYMLSKMLLRTNYLGER
ncbi:MAG: alkaline phosphatase family protein [Acholeplasma sp.]|nr:MAG: alkaline phosphatase family protein [Acholeplasma sp.]